MDDWLSKVTTWLFSLFTRLFTDLVTFLHDGAVWIFDGIVSAFAGLIAAIPAPSFLTGYSIIGQLNLLPPYARFVLDQMQIGTALAIVLSGVVFRLLRKFFTIGQW